MLDSEEARLVASYLQAGGRMLVCPAQGVKAPRRTPRRAGKLPNLDYYDSPAFTDRLAHLPSPDAALTQAYLEASEARFPQGGRALDVNRPKSAPRGGERGTLARYAWRAILRHMRGAKPHAYGFRIEHGV